MIDYGGPEDEVCITTGFFLADGFLYDMTSPYDAVYCSEDSKQNNVDILFNN